MTTIENNPMYQHSIEDNTRFLASLNGKDYYYRQCGFHYIDIRYSNDPTDYTTWPIMSVLSAYKKDFKLYTELIPKWILNKAVETI